MDYNDSMNFSRYRAALQVQKNESIDLKAFQEQASSIDAISILEERSLARAWGIHMLVEKRYDIVANPVLAPAAGDQYRLEGSSIGQISTQERFVGQGWLGLILARVIGHPMNYSPGQCEVRYRGLAVHQAPHAVAYTLHASTPLFPAYKEALDDIKRRADFIRPGSDDAGSIKFAAPSVQQDRPSPRAGDG